MDKRGEGDEPGIEGPVQEALIPLKDIPGEQFQVTQFHQGPIPRPEDLARYAEIQPDLVDRIVGMAEVDLSARTDAIRVTSKAEAFAVSVGAVASLALPLVFLALAVALALLGFPASVVVIIGAIGPTLVGVAKIVSAVRGHPVDEDS